MNLLELAIKIFVDDSEAKKGLDETEKKATSMASSLGKGVAKAAKIGAAAIGTMATGISAVTKQAVSAYGEYEQLAGGIETLYKSSSNKMMEYANNAYKTAGMSVNDYMTTAIESSAAMINSLGGDTAKAAEMTNMAIIDMSDNVNKMGTTMEALQNAYRGFSRGNYTMLDNLSLGFAGTKEGMKELLAKAKELSGVEYDIESYADIVQAIHVVQSEMGITGTTAKEGADTITGSMATVRAAWENLITGFANPNADLGKLIDDLVANAEVAFGNLLPTISHALEGAAKFIDHIAPMIAEKLPALADQILPPLLSAATTLVTALLKALPKFIPIIIKALPGIISQIWKAIVDIFKSQSPAIGGVLDTIGKFFATAFGWIVENGDFVIGLLTDLLKAFLAYEAVGFVIGIIQGISAAMEALTLVMSANPIGIILVALVALIAVIKNLWENNEEFRNAVISAWEQIKSVAQSVADSVVAAFTAVAEWFGNLVQSIQDFFAPLIEWFEPLLTALADLFGSIFALIKQTVMDEVNQQKEQIMAGWNAIVEFFTPMLETLKELVNAAFTIIKDYIVGAFTDAYNEVIQPLQEMWDFVEIGFNKLGEIIGNIIEKAKEWGADLVKNFVGGMTANRDYVVEGANVITGAIKSRLHFSKPDEGPLADFDTYAPDMMKLFAQGIKDNEDLVADQIDKSFDLKAGITDDSEFGSQSVDGGTSGGAMEQVIALLQALVNKQFVVDANGIYQVVREQNMIYSEANGGASGL